MIVKPETWQVLFVSMNSPMIAFMTYLRIFLFLTCVFVAQNTRSWSTVMRDYGKLTSKFIPKSFVLAITQLVIARRTTEIAERHRRIHSGTSIKCHTS